MTKLTTEVKKPARVRVAAPKAAPKVKHETKVPPATKHLFVLQAIARPKEGARLFAHTQAVFELFGMFRGRSVERPRLVAYLGVKAVCYHIGLGNLREAGSAVSVTSQGKEFFAARHLDKEVVKGFLDVFKTGKANAAAQVKAFQIEQVPA